MHQGVSKIQCYCHSVDVDYPSHTRGYGITPLNMEHAPPPPGSLAAHPMRQMISKL